MHTYVLLRPGLSNHSSPDVNMRHGSIPAFPNENIVAMAFEGQEESEILCISRVNEVEDVSIRTDRD